MNYVDLNKALGLGYRVGLTAVDTSNGDCKALFTWYEVNTVTSVETPLFSRGTVSSLIAAAKEELGNRFIREHGLDTEVPADTLRDGKTDLFPKGWT